MTKKEAATYTLEQILANEKPEALIKELSFENGLKLLEELVSKVESGSLPLDKAISSYERGALVVEQLKALLAGAEGKLQVLQKGK